jgi:hypothetical protein
MKPSSADIDITANGPGRRAQLRPGIRVLDPDRRRPARIVVGVAAVLAAALLLDLSVPRLFSAIEASDAVEIAEQAQAGDPRLTDQQMAHAARALQHALSWQEDADLAALLAATRLTQAERAESQAQAAPLLAMAVEAAKRAIRQSPAHPTAWALLARALEGTDARDPQFPVALARAIAVAPYDPRYLPQRIEMACRHWHRLDAATHALAAAQIRILAGRDLRLLATITKRSLGLAPVRAALAGDAGLLDRFDAIYIALP